MPIIKWRESYNTGIGKFDKEHQKIVSLINEMYEILRGDLAIDRMQDMIKELFDYTQYHFSGEEEALEKVNSPDLQQQQQAHAVFLSEIESFQKRLDEGMDKTIAADFNKFLRNWLLNHIVVMDKKYNSALQGR